MDTSFVFYTSSRVSIWGLGLYSISDYIQLLSEFRLNHGLQ